MHSRHLKDARIGAPRRHRIICARSSFGGCRTVAAAGCWLLAAVTANNRETRAHAFHFMSRVAWRCALLGTMKCSRKLCKYLGGCWSIAWTRDMVCHRIFVYGACVCIYVTFPTTSTAIPRKAHAHTDST